MKVVPLPARPDCAARPDGQAPGVASSSQIATGEAAAAEAAAEVQSNEPTETPVRVRIRRRRRVKRNAAAAVIARSLDSAQRQQRDALGGLERQPSAKPASTRGDVDGVFWPVWLEHRGYLRNHALRFSGGNMADAEDALSEAMLKAAQSFSPAKIRNHRSWLLRLVHNACMDRHRSNSRRQRVARDILAGDARAAPAVVVQPDRSPEELLAAFEQVADLRQAMGDLPAFLAEPLMLYLDEHSDSEIAGSLNVTKEVVRKRRQIARALLRRRIFS